VPGVVTVILAWVPRLVPAEIHEYEPPPVAVKAILVVVQVNTAGLGALEIAAVGAVIFCVITTALVAVQPFVADVTVTVYVPGVVTVKFAVVLTTVVPLDQE
jgi:hypothetical protein